MGAIIESLEGLIGDTPLFHFARYEKAHELKAQLLGKLEWYNPTGSIKDRAAINMIRKAEEEGRIKPGDTIVEQTSGNTGIGLAAFAAVKGYRMEIFLERGASVERRILLTAYGAKLLTYHDIDRALSEAPGEPSLSRENAEGDGWVEPDREASMAEIYRYCEKKGYYYINQVTNRHNPEAHVLTTGPEIWEATEGKVDILVCMAGTGGTMTGLSRYFKEKNPNFQLVLVQPHPESRLTEANPEVQIIDGVLPVLRVPKEELSEFLDPTLCCECFDVRTEEAFETARELVKREGLLIGTSAAAAVHVAAKIAEREENRGKNIVIILPDSGMKYLSTGMYQGG